MILSTGLQEDYKPVEAINEADGVYIVRWDCKPLPEGGNMVVWAEEMLYGKPVESEMRRIINGYYNGITDCKILQDFTWHGMPVWLSDENQRNYKAAYDLAVQTGGETLPVVFKFGSDEQPVYHTFGTMDELKEFYMSVYRHIEQCLADGWANKDAVDYGVYELDGL